MIVTSHRYRYGYHVRKRKTLTDTIHFGLSTPLTAMQIYLAGSRGFNIAKFEMSDIMESRRLLKKYDMFLCTHSLLVHNLAGKVDPDDPNIPELLRKTVAGVVSELDVMAALDCGVVIHIGCCKDRKRGIATIVETIIRCFEFESSNTKEIAVALAISPRELRSRRKLFLEIDSGSKTGTKIGDSLEEIAEIISGCSKYNSQIGVCIDTAHIYGAGLYDFGRKEEVRKFYDDFDRILGLEKLKVFHLNDSRRSESKQRDASFGSKKDRHEYLGRGYIFDESEPSRLEGLKEFFFQARKHNIPIIGEPPHNIEDEEGKCKDGPGGVREFQYVADLLSDTEYPLVGEF